jgi:hypothetical protein
MRRIREWWFVAEHPGRSCRFWELVYVLIGVGLFILLAFVLGHLTAGPPGEFPDGTPMFKCYAGC